MDPPLYHNIALSTPFTQMEAEQLLETFDSLLARRDDDINKKGGSSASPPLSRSIPHQHERSLVALVLLSRSPQEQLDQVWEKYESDFTSFASIFFKNCDFEMQLLNDDHAVSQNGFKNFLFCSYYTRLVAQVTARLTKPPTKQLQYDIYKSWRKISMMQAARTVTITSTAVEEAKIHSTIIALCVDIYNALITWTSQNDPLLSVDLDLIELWNIPITAYKKMNRITRVVQREAKTKKEQPKVEDDEVDMMLSILESASGSASDEVRAGQENDDIYTFSNTLRLMFVLFELQGPESISDELLRTVLIWIKNSQDEISDADLRVLWDGWLLTNIQKRISKTNNTRSLLRDPEIMDTIQKIILAHVVSPTTSTLRPLAWQSISQITKSFGWEFLQKSSESSLCTWCRLACGEWKIQLEDEPSERQKNLSILDGCGNLIINVVQYLVDFDERPYKSIPLTSESLLSIRQELEETLSLTSGHLLNRASEEHNLESTIMVNLWSVLFSEMHASNCHEASNIMLCFHMLLQVSDDESLVPAVLHVVSMMNCDGRALTSEHESVTDETTTSIIGYLIRLWKRVAKMDYLKQSQENHFVHSACVATEILAEHDHPKFQEVVQFIFEAQQAILKTFQNGGAAQERQHERTILRSLSNTCGLLFDRYHKILPQNTSYNLSTATAML